MKKIREEKAKQKLEKKDRTQKRLLEELENEINQKVWFDLLTFDLGWYCIQVTDEDEKIRVVQFKRDASEDETHRRKQERRQSVIRDIKDSLIR